MSTYTDEQIHAATSAFIAALAMPTEEITEGHLTEAMPAALAAYEATLVDMEIQQDSDGFMVVQDLTSGNIEEPEQDAITLSTALDAAQALIARRSSRAASANSQPEHDERVAYNPGDVVMIKA